MEYKVSPFFTVTQPGVGRLTGFDACGVPTFRSETGAIRFLSLQATTSADNKMYINARIILFSYCQ